MPSEGIRNLINLRHVYFNHENCMPTNIGRLTCLQTLQFFFVGKKRGYRIKELGYLSGLKGRLEIHNLQHVKDKSEAMEAKLYEKAIDQLNLIWGKEGNHDNDDEAVSEGLQPPSELRSLIIEGYGGKNLPSWMLKGSESLLFNRLVKLSIKGCKKLNNIPIILGFSSLKLLSVSGCAELTSVEFGAFVVGSLEELMIESCLMLESAPVSGLSKLQKLRITKCRGLSSIGSLSASKGLKDFYLEACPNLTYIPSMEGLTSLQKLSFIDCDGLECLPNGLSSCPALDLDIWNCPNMLSLPKELKELLA